jgi:coniferyl-aldehyde dehydrogenase
VQRSYPNGIDDPAYASIVSPEHHERLKRLVEDARKKGARIIEIGSGTSSLRAHTMVPTVILGATAEMSVMQREIFGPVLPIVPYRTLNDAIDYVNARARPLALYIFSTRPSQIREILTRTTSGNVTVNDTLLHYIQDDLPFGGVGPSGMGAYHGEEGFRSLSHAKGVFTQSRFTFAGLTRAPFSRFTDLVLSYLFR